MSEALYGRGLYVFVGLSSNSLSPTSDDDASTWAKKPLPGQRAFETDDGAEVEYQFNGNKWRQISTKTSDGGNAGLVVEGMSSDKVIIDNNADGNQYIGYATQGSATSASVWAITKNDNSSPIQSFTHSQPNQIWDDRTSGAYT